MPPAANNCQKPTTGPHLPLDLPDLPHGLATGRGVSITVVDTGAANPGTTGDRDHCLLHGTAVASVAKTIAPGSALHSISHSPHPDRAEGTVADLIGALDRAREHKSKIINLSMVACEDLPALRSAVSRVHDAGALLVAPIGNRGQCEEGTAPFPAHIDGVIAVGAVDPRSDTPEEGTWDAGRVAAEYSAPGPWADIYAPGGPVSAQLQVDGKVQTVVGDPHPFLGTSFATPVVSGTAALVWEVLPDSDATLVRSILLETSTPGGAVPGRAEPLLVVNPQAAVERALELKHVADTGAAEGARDAEPRLATSVTAAPHIPEDPDYIVPGAVVLVVCVVAIVALVARALLSDSKPAAGSMETTRHGA